MTTPAEKKIAEIRQYGVRAQGREELIAFLQGKRVTPIGLIKAECYDCMGYYSDGVDSCENPLCPLYSRQPYRKHTPPEKKSHQTDGRYGGVAHHATFHTDKNAGAGA